MQKIDIDFDVYKEITVRRATENISANDVLREVFGLPTVASKVEKAAEVWGTKGVEFPFGTKFRATYKGQIYQASVTGSGLVFRGESYSSPSAAAMAITEKPVNGWTFWECQLPGSDQWTVIKTLRS